jgi:hypothetical protein
MKKLELPIEDRKELSKEVREKARKEKEEMVEIELSKLLKFREDVQNGNDGKHRGEDPGIKEEQD